MNQRAHYVKIGGFLGAGKTTSIGRFARHLDAAGKKVGLITNDQGAGLVDSALGRAGDFAVEEISGGCFCCRFSSLLDAARELDSATRPDILLAEPVGSCTDLVATVSLPLQKIYGGDYTIAPLSVVIDPIRALRVLELEDGKKFSDNVRYIYRKQLEEAAVIVINKCDLLDEGRLATLRAGLEAEYPKATLFEVSAREETGLEAWFEHVLNHEMEDPLALEIDYDRYGDGEALLGWLNSTVEIEEGDGEFDGNELLGSLASALRHSLEAAGAEVAHLKMTLTPKGDYHEIGAVNLVRDGIEPELSHHLSEPLDDGELLLNLRAEAAPELLDKAVTDALESTLGTKLGLSFEVTHSEHFRPGKPEPEHRLTPSPSQ